MADSYHVLELIGEGSFGRVYKGRKKYSGQVCIVNSGVNLLTKLPDLPGVGLFIFSLK